MMNHLACIMDGNRRWALRKGILPWYGHRKGVDTLTTVVDFCLEKSIKYLSLYAFSVENFSRPQQETRYLFQMLATEADSLLRDCVEKKVRLHFIGDRSLFPKELVPVCERLERKTASCDALQVNILFCYGGRQEITDAIKRIVHEVQEGSLDERALTADLLEQYLWTAGTPAPDLIIRTGGAQRLSNFLTYQAAYSELYFLDCLWPDVTKSDLDKAVTYYNSCQRNFGV